MSPICWNSAMPKPRVVPAGVPSRTPEVTVGFSGSNGMAFLLQVIRARPSAASATLPVSRFLRRSTDIKCVSVPPDTMSKPQALSLSESAFAFSTTFLAYDRNDGRNASPKATALAAITCINGPPCIPGNTAALSFFASSSSLLRMAPPRGPRSVLCVAGDQPGKVRHVDHKIGADLIGDLAEAAEVDNARIGRAAGYDQFGPMLFGEPLDLLHVDEMVVAAHAVRHRFEPAAGKVYGRAVREMSAGCEAEPHKSVAGLHPRHEDFRIGGSAGMRLDIGETAPEQAARPLDRQPFGYVDILAAAVITLSRQALGILIGEHRALRLKHGAADDVLRRDKFDLVTLAAQFELDRFGNFRIAFGKHRRVEILISSIDLVACRHGLSVPRCLVVGATARCSLFRRRAVRR